MFNVKKRLISRYIKNKIITKKSILNSFERKNALILFRLKITKNEMIITINSEKALENINIKGSKHIKIKKYF